MTELRAPYYITTPIYYVNDSPHIGHAYTTIACDVMARFMRLSDRDTYFLTGTDEHGQKVAKSAEAANIDAQSFTDEVSLRFQRLVQTPNGKSDNILNVTNNDFIRTTEARHAQAAQELWKRIEANGFIYKDTYGGWYAIRDEAYYAETELVKKDGKSYAPSGAEVEWVEEESYFFRLSAFEDQLLELYSQPQGFVSPESRLNEVSSFVKGGLRDLSISRTTFNWGVPVPGDEKHVMYVWIDALTNYLTSLGFPDEGDNYEDFWASEAVDAPVHVVGKDILRFHAVYWPAFLLAAGLPLPKLVVAHGWWTIEGEKMSKSLGNALSPDEMIERAGGIDQLRYYMLKAMPFGNDGDFSNERMVEVINADLANNIGNLAQRTLSMIQKNCDGKIPVRGMLNKEAQHNISELYARASAAGSALPLEKFRFDAALEEILKHSTKANSYIDTMAPWTLKKIDPEQMASVLYALAEQIRCIAILLQPFCPSASSKILDQLAVSKEARSFKCLHADYALVPDTALPAPTGVFPRLQSIDKAA